MKTSPSTKFYPYVRSAFLTAALSGAGVLAFRLYHYPMETFDALSRGMLLLSGAREDICDLHGLPMHYYSAGRRGTPIILIHGLGNSAEIWATLFPFLSKDFLVYAPDMPGFGQTKLAPEGVTVRTHVHYLGQFLDALGYPQVILVGNSLGGWIATHFAAMYPERVEHLYLLNSAGLRREQMQSPYATDRSSAQRSMDNIWGYHLPLPGFILDAVVRISQIDAYKEFIMRYDVAEELDEVLPQVRTPTTIIWGKRDGVFPLVCAYDFQRSLPNAQLRLLEHIGHMPQVQAPAQVARIIKKTSLEM